MKFQHLLVKRACSSDKLNVFEEVIFFKSENIKICISVSICMFLNVRNTEDCLQITC